MRPYTVITPLDVLLILCCSEISLLNTIRLPIHFCQYLSRGVLVCMEAEQCIGMIIFRIKFFSGPCISFYFVILDYSYDTSLQYWNRYAVEIIPSGCESLCVLRVL